MARRWRLSWAGAFDNLELIDCVAQDNSAGSGGSAYRFADLGSGGNNPVRITGGSVIRNTGDPGAALDVGTGWRLEAHDVDFGLGTDDNTPSDVDGCARNFGPASHFRFDRSADPSCY